MIPDEGGVLPVDKPEGPTSHDIVARARRGLGTRRVGHTGTLDPFASGLLLLCVGPATRLSPWLTHQPKSYRARAVLGITTTTLDPEGEVVQTRDGWQELTEDEVRDALAAFTGRQDQLPPAFSAKKVGGEAAHRRARRGEEVRLTPVQVEVHELELLCWDPPALDFRVRCSSGTYIRALARDVGERLGMGAHLTALRRTAVGSIEVGEAVSADALDRVPPAAWIRPAAALARAGLPTVRVGRDEVRRLAMGQGVTHSGDPVEGVVAVVDAADRLVAVGESEGTRLRPRKVFVQP